MITCVGEEVSEAAICIPISSSSAVANAVFMAEKPTFPNPAFFNYMKLEPVLYLPDWLEVPLMSTPYPY